MGDVGVFVIYATIALITSLGLILGWINYKINKCKDEINDIDVGKENAAAAVWVLEGLIRNLNAVCHDHQKRLDILEANHPDDEIDYGTVDDDGNITEVWFNGKRYVPEDKRNDIDYTKTDGDGNILAVWFKGKKYVPEDKRDEDAIKIYVDNKVIAETARHDPQPESRYGCSDCVRFRRARIDGKWSGICSVDNVIMSNDEQYICDKFRLYKSTADLVTSDKDEAEYIRFNHIYWDMDGNNKADRVAKRIDELQCEIQRLNMIAQFGCTAQELRQRWEELMRDDT